MPKHLDNQTKRTLTNQRKLSHFKTSRTKQTVIKWPILYDLHSGAWQTGHKSSLQRFPEPC